MSSKLVETLAQFNRKERYWLLRNALGQSTDPKAVPDAPPLSDEFRARLRRQLELEIPSNAWWAMDYHLDWLYAATVLLRGKQQPAYSNELSRTGTKGIQGNQEDIDFLIAFDKTLILIEAKGDTPWSNEQLSSKWNRLQHIFGELGENFKPMPELDNVVYLLMSPRGIEAVKVGDLNHYVWLQLAMDEKLLKVTRCTEDGTVNRSGEFWKTESIKKTS
jgi:hypothetical protein